MGQYFLYFNIISSLFLAFFYYYYFLSLEHESGNLLRNVHVAVQQTKLCAQLEQSKIMLKMKI